MKTTGSLHAMNSLVLIGEGAIQGRVVAIMLEATNVSYKIAWWDKETRKCEWMYDAEVRAIGEDSPKTTFGFKNWQPSL